MKLSSPKVMTWWISFILGVVGILMYIGSLSIPALAPFVFWMEAVAFALLALGTLLKGF